MNKFNLRILIAVAIYILITIIVFAFGWWLVGLALIFGGVFILYRISGSSIGITQLDFLKKIPGNKSWWSYGLLALSTLYYVLLGFGVFKWEWVQFNVLIMLLIIALSAILAGSKDIPSNIQGVMKLWAILSVVGILVLIIATRFYPGLIQNLDYSHSSNTPEKSTQQQEQVAPAPVEEIISTERVVVSGRKITLTGDGTYNLPPGQKSICLTNLGMKDGSQYVIQNITINGIEYIFHGTKCIDISELQGDLFIDFFPGEESGTNNGFKKLYNYWKLKPGGQAELPIIRIGE